MSPKWSSSNICEIGKERIRHAAKKIAADNPGNPFDGGFRVFKLDDTNMTDGKQILQELSEYLASQFGKGFSVGNLENIRRFNLSWFHYLKIMRIDNAGERHLEKVMR